MPTSEIAMNADVQIGHVIGEAGPWPCGTLALYDLVLVFAADDRAQPITLALTDIRRASFMSSAAADEIRIKTYGGPAWAIRVRSGMELITALRLRGVAVAEAR
jgi:hypothetical protein